MKDLQTVLDALSLAERTSYSESNQDKFIEAISIVKQMMQAEPVCNPHPKAPHGFSRNSSHAAGRYVCECEGWDAWEAGYQAAVESDYAVQQLISTTEDLGLYAAPQAVPDPMTLMTDASIMQVAKGWREFDAPDGSGPVDSMVYGACRAALNKYRDLLLEAK